MNQRKSLPMLAGFALAVCGMSVLAFAPIGGRVTTVVGSAGILRDQVAMPAEKGGVLQSGDLLNTPADGRLQWWMEDDSMVAMASSSQVHIRRFEPEAGEATYSLQSGSMRIISGTVHPTVLTPLAKVSALGTDFSTFLCAATCSGKGTKGGHGKPNKDALSLYVRVSEGRVRVQNAAGDIVATKGQIVYVPAPDQAPTIIVEASAIVIETSVELEFEIAAGDFIPDVPTQPIPPVEPPGSPS